MTFVWFFFLIQVLVPFFVMVPFPDLVPVPVLDQTWSRSHHISGPGHGLGPGPSKNFWSRLTVTVNHQSQ